MKRSQLFHPQSLVAALAVLAALLFEFFAPCASAATVTVVTNNTVGTTSWTCPAGVYSVQVECWGGGGAGGPGAKQTAGSNTSQNGGGGGGGAYARRNSLPVTPGQSYTITIPAAAVSGANGIASGGGIVSGGSVTFVGDSGVTVTAAGGTGGKCANSGTSNSTTGQGGGAGGTAAASVGEVVFAGGAGSAGNTGSTSVPGSGGGGAGNANPGGDAVTTSSTTTPGSGGVAGGGAGGAGRGSGNGTSYPGNSGVTPGGGGAGAKNCGNSTTLGGTGGLGQIVLTYTPITNVKANNTDNLNVASSWTENVPSSADVAAWNNTVTGPNTTALGADLTFGGIMILDPAGLVTIDGPNTLTLGAAAIDIDMHAASVDLTLNCPLALGAANVWDVTTSRTLTLAGPVSGAFPVTMQDAGTVTLSGTNTYTGPTTISAGTLAISGTGTLGSGSYAGNITNAGVFNYASSASQTNSGVISGAGSLTMSSGVLILSGANTYTGGTTIAAGTLQIGNGGSTGSIANTAWVANNGALVYNRSDAALNVGYGISGSGTVTMAGTGTVTLSGFNTYSGATTISAGELAGATSGSCSSSSVTVAAGATNGVLVQAANGQWACGALTYSAGATCADFNFNGLTPSTTTAPLQVTGALTFTGTPTVLLRNLAGVTSGVYRLISYGSISGTPPTTFTSPNASGSISNDAVNQVLVLVVTNGNGDINPLLWSGGNGNWDINTSANWKDSSGTTGLVYLDGANVVLDDTASGSSPILVTNAVTVSPASVTANLTNINYVISGSPIAGATVLTKNGNGTLTLSGANSYTGGTTINGGTLQLSGAGTPGAATTKVTLNSGALLDLNGTSQNIMFTNVTGPGTVANNSGSGTSTLTLAGPAPVNGSLVTINDYTTTPGGKVAVVIQANTQPLNNLNTYTGGTTVNPGAFLYLNSANPNGAGTGTINLPSFGGTGATSSGLVVDGVTYANDIAGAGYVHCNANSGATAVTVTLTGNINTSGPFIFRGGTGIAYNFAGNGTTSVLSGVIGSTTSMVNGAVATGSLIKSGTGLLTLSGANLYSGGTTISAGTLRLGTNNAIPGNTIAGNVTVSGTLDLNTYSDSVNGLSGGGTVDTVAGGTPTLTVGGKNASSTFSGAIQNSLGTLSLTKTGTGMLTLSGTNTYSGATTISAGTLQIGVSGTNNPVTIANNSFETPTTTTYVYNPSGAGWTFSAASGVCSNTFLATTPPQGLQAGFIQGTGTISQSVTVAADGLYAISFQAEGRGGTLGPEGVILQVDGTAVGTWPASAVSQSAWLSYVALVNLTAGSHTLTFIGNNTLGGDKSVAIDNVQMYQPSGAGVLPSSSAVNFTASGAALDLSGTAQTIGSLAGVAGSSVLNGSLTAGGDGTSTTFGGVFSGGGGLTKTGAGVLTLSGTNTYTGATTVSNGTLLVNGGLSSPVTVSARATLGGTGTVSGSVNNNGTLSAGAGVGTFSTGSQTWNGGATNRFELSSAVNSANMDLLNITGTLDVQATAGNPFRIKLVSMAGNTTPGLVPDFDANTSYTWTNATASGGILNFDPGKFAIDASGFSNAYTGTFSVAVQGNSLVVNYSVVLAPPVLSGFGPRSGTSFPLTFSGPNGQSYKVLSSTNVALPLSSWTTQSSGIFGVGGPTSTNYTDTSATNAAQFYRIQSP